MYIPLYMLLKQWGPITWYVFHSLSYKLDKNDVTFSKVLFNEFSKICNILPCPICRNHAKKYLYKKKINNQYELTNFFFDFHNNVNRRNKKRLFTMEEFETKYSKANINVILKNFERVMTLNSYKLSIDTFERERVVKIFCKFINSNMRRFTR